MPVPQHGHSGTGVECRRTKAPSQKLDISGGSRPNLIREVLDCSGHKLAAGRQIVAFSTVQRAQDFSLTAKTTRFAERHQHGQGSRPNHPPFKLRTKSLVLP